MATELRTQDEVPSRIERKVYKEPEEQEEEPQHHRPSPINFALMIMVAVIFDILSLFLSEIPFVGAVIVFTADAVFIPWFYMSGMKLTNKRVTALGIQTLAESIPIVGNLPLITANVIYSYYSN